MSDVDGVTSCVIAYLYLKHIGLNNIQVLFHTDKQHGLTKEIMEQIGNDASLVWLPDAGTNDVEQCKELYDKGIKILITDHHIKSKPNPYATIINNQTSPNVSNKHLAGVGVTFKFIQYCCIKNNDKFYTTLLDLVALGNISDVMDMRTLENRAINKWGLNHITNPFFKALCQARVRNNFKITPVDIQWSITPLINSVCRSDNQELKRLLFKVFIGEFNDFNYVIGQLVDQHTKQSNFVSKMYNSLIKGVEQTDDTTMIIECDNTPYTGLVANKLRDYYNKNVLLVHNDNGEYIGSCRAYNDLLTPLNKSGLMTICAGHNNVFGVGWLEKDNDKLKEYLRNLSLTNEPNYVTIVYNNEPLPRELFTLSEQYSDIWGTNIPKPSAYFHIPLSDINIKLIGAGRTLKFTYDDMEFIKFRISNKDKEISGKYVDIIGSMQMNYYMGREKKQIVIDKWESE